jgi:hypothetical protein
MIWDKVIGAGMFGFCPHFHYSIIPIYQSISAVSLYNEFFKRYSISSQEKGFCLTRLFYRALRLKPCRKPLLDPLGGLVDHGFIIEFKSWDTYLTQGES